MPKPKIRKIKPEQIEEIISLQKQGVGVLELGRRYGVDHTTIIHHLRRHSDYDHRPRGRPLASPTIVTDPAIFNLTNERELMEEEKRLKINEGHDYDWYLAKAGYRRTKDGAIRKLSPTQKIIDVV
jgi:IS30 family transposase